MIPIGIIAIRKQIADTTPPSTPLNLSGSQTSSNSVLLTWIESSDNVGVVQYYVYLSLNHNGPYDFITSSLSTDVVVYGLNPDGDYWFNVRAIDANNNFSNPSTPINIVLFGGESQLNMQ